MHDLGVRARRIEEGNVFEFDITFKFVHLSIRVILLNGGGSINNVKGRLCLCLCNSNC